MRVAHRACLVLTVLILGACTGRTLISRVERYRDAHHRGDVATEASLLAPDARIWYEERSGPGDPLKPGRAGRYAHWDDYFHSTSHLSDWRVDGRAVSATVRESNDFYRLLDWEPLPYRMTWWFDTGGRIEGAMVESQPGKAPSRMAEFRAWAAANRPAELEYLMPDGKIDPTADRPERFRALLTEWRRASGLSLP